MTPAQLLREWLQTRLPADALAWMEQQVEQIGSTGRDADLYLAFSLAPRRSGKRQLALSAQEMQAAAAVRQDWHPREWRIDEAVRLYLLLATATDGDIFARRLEQLYATADVAELVTLYRGLPLYPDPERYRLRAAEGLRTNMRTVFEAVAHHNPYPAEQLPQAAWNQMVLKALFIGTALDPITGLDRRANPELARMLCDYAHERWAAGRSVSPELWRCVGPFATGAMLDDLRRVLERGTRTEQIAAMLALRQSPDSRAPDLMRTRSELAEAAASKRFDWHSMAFAA